MHVVYFNSLFTSVQLNELQEMKLLTANELAKLRTPTTTLRTPTTTLVHTISGLLLNPFLRSALTNLQLMNAAREASMSDPLHALMCKLGLDGRGYSEMLLQAGCSSMLILAHAEKDDIKEVIGGNALHASAIIGEAKLMVEGWSFGKNRFWNA